MAIEKAKQVFSYRIVGNHFFGTWTSLVDLGLDPKKDPNISRDLDPKTLALDPETLALDLQLDKQVYERNYPGLF